MGQWLQSVLGKWSPDPSSARQKHPGFRNPSLTHLIQPESPGGHPGKPGSSGRSVPRAVRGSSFAFQPSWAGVTWPPKSGVEQSYFRSRRSICPPSPCTTPKEWTLASRRRLCTQQCTGWVWSYLRPAWIFQVGWPYCQAAWQAAGFPPSLLVPVPEQKDPHPDFPTGIILLLALIINNKLVKSSFLYKVEYPNPEEGASSLDLAFRTAEASGARLQFPE